MPHIALWLSSVGSNLVTVVPDSMVVPEASALYPLSASSPQFPKMPKAGVALADGEVADDHKDTGGMDTARSARTLMDKGSHGEMASSMSPEEKVSTTRGLVIIHRYACQQVDMHACTHASMDAGAEAMAAPSTEGFNMDPQFAATPYPNYRRIMGVALVLFCRSAELELLLRENGAQSCLSMRHWWTKDFESTK
ncbi:hypothetical protein AK812_SmicGene37838 [Symbiodinium microadriaticum]|uniref:Uncharacterized protein n=1 Tax=Symbiodinium microadriaticum TaxID=2951 RepID=A0A1Q9CFC0_SYMMI|nr:hypothetical protein AK812_SmicGene37838 [Symbiodinium microadriaticum]